MHKVQKSFGEKIILNHFNYTFQRNERIGIIGKSGTGKSTFLNLLTSNDTVDSGKIIWGETKFGYYTQKGIRVKEEQKVIDGLAVVVGLTYEIAFDFGVINSEPEFEYLMFFISFSYIA